MKANGGGETVFSDKLRRSKSREVNSRFLSPTSSTLIDGGIPSPNQITNSPIHQKPRSSIDGGRKNRIIEDSGFTRGLWPSSTSSSTSSRSHSNKVVDTLADHLGNDRLKDLAERKRIEKSENSMFLNRQRSCTEFSRFENEKEISKKNHKPLFGGSMRYTGKFKFPGRSSKSSGVSDDHDTDMVPGRFSVDENTLQRKSYGRASDSLSDTQDSESECSDMCSGASLNSPTIGKVFPASYMASTASSRNSGVEVPSKYMQNLSSRSRRWSSTDSNMTNPASLDDISPKKFTLKNAMRRANSLTAYGSAKSKWALSPGRSGSPPMTVENKGKPMSFSSLKPPTSPSRAKGVGNLLTMGLELFKSKKSSTTSLGTGATAESVHQLRLLHNRLLQWRYANAKAEAVNVNINTQAESNLIYAWDGLARLRHSVVQKKLQLEKQKLEMKLFTILHSQIKPLETWGDMERQHSVAVSDIKECLRSVLCKVPLIEGAKAEQQSTSIAMRQASDLATSMKLMLSVFSPTTERTVSMLSELAEIVAQEKCMLEECLELFRNISILEIEERSLKCNVIQLKLWQQQKDDVKRD